MREACAQFSRLEGVKTGQAWRRPHPLRPEIAVRLAEAGALGADAFLRVAVAAADLPPVLEGVDPAARWVAEEKARRGRLRLSSLAALSGPS